jgi:pyruvate kinase
MRELGHRRAMLSFVESEEDVAELRAELPGVEPMLKVESRRGLAFARRHGGTLGRLVAARGDLYVEVREPHRIVGALRDVIAADPDAVAASRLFPTLSRAPVPVAAEICDAAFLLALGYRTFLLGDEVCLRREPVLAALDLLAAVAGEMG